MSRAAPPSLSSASVLWISREGGVAHFPGLERPRRISCASCSETERRELQRLLSSLPARAEQAPRGADRRVFIVTVDDTEAGRWRVEVGESQAPEALKRLWRGEVAKPRVDKRASD